MITKVIENRLRRAAKRQGYELHKSRARDPRSIYFGKYRLAHYRPRGWMTAAEVALALQEPLFTACTEEEGDN